MGIPRYDSGLCFDAASAPDRERLAGPAVDAPPASWSNPTTDEPWNGPDKGPAVETWKDATGYGGGAVTGTKIGPGVATSIIADTPVPGTATIQDAGGPFLLSMVGGSIAISGSVNPANDGLFAITGFTDATKLEYHNPGAVNEGAGATYATNVADNGYGADPLPTQSWRYDVDLPAGWYTRSTTSKKHSGQQ